MPEEESETEPEAFTHFVEGMKLATFAIIGVLFASSFKE